MDAIIRSVNLSGETRQLRRASERKAAPSGNAGTPATAPVPPVAPIAPAKPVAPVKPSAAPAPAPAPAAPTAKAAAPTLFVKPSDVAPAPFATAYEDEKERQLEAERAAKRKVEQELASLKSKTDEELAALRAEAEKRGFAAGQAKGEAAAQEMLQTQVDRFKSLAMQLSQSRAKVLEDAEDSIVEIVFTAICRVLGEQAATRTNIIRMVRDCVGEARDPNQVNVRLHPDDVSLLQDSVASGIDVQVRISADPDIRLGGCVVESATGSLDARLETQLERLQASLQSVRAERKNTGDAI